MKRFAAFALLTLGMLSVLFTFGCSSERYEIIHEKVMLFSLDEDKTITQTCIGDVLELTGYQDDNYPIFRVVSTSHEDLYGLDKEHHKRAEVGDVGWTVPGNLKAMKKAN